MVSEDHHDLLASDEAEALGYDGTGRDGDPRFPYRWSNLTEEERERLLAYLEPFVRNTCPLCGGQVILHAGTCPWLSP
jgi:hypothetical protein